MIVTKAKRHATVLHATNYSAHRPAHPYSFPRLLPITYVVIRGRIDLTCLRADNVLQAPETTSDLRIVSNVIFFFRLADIRMFVNW
jgi:hypothetical protein